MDMPLYFWSHIAAYTIRSKCAFRGYIGQVLDLCSSKMTRCCRSKKEAGVFTFLGRGVLVIKH